MTDYVIIRMSGHRRRSVGLRLCTKGETEEELWRDGTEHLIKVHDMKAEDITPQFKYHYKQYIKHH